MNTLQCIIEIGKEHYVWYVTCVVDVILTYAILEWIF